VTSIRIATIDAPHFACGPISVGRSWSAVEVNEKARTVLLVYVGRIVQIHPFDVGKLGELGLALEGGRLVESTVSLTSVSGESQTRATEPQRKRR
jgi:hypothetical protein